MEFIFGFLGGLASWPALILLIECAAIIACVERQGSGGFALLSIVITAALLVFLFGINPLAYVIEHPFTALLAVAAYLATGIVWARFRLGRYLKQWVIKWHNTQSEREKKEMYGSRPTLANSKDRILGWMMFWPWSALWWTLADMVVDLFNKLYEMLGGFFGKVIERYMQGITDPGDASVDSKKRRKNEGAYSEADG